MENHNYVSSGAYGCVFAPAFPCGTPKTKTPIKTIGKLFDKQKTFDEEVANMKLLSERVPDCDKFSFHITEQCKLKEFKTNSMPDRKQCTALKSEVWQITYPHGGFDLENLSKQGKNQSFHARKNWFINTIFRSIENLLEGIKSMSDAKLVHTDIKPGNILYNGRASNKLKFIDFGLLRSFEKMFIQAKEHKFFDNVYLYFPPELFAYNRSLEKKTEKEITDHILEYLNQVDSYFGSSYLRALNIVYNDESIVKNEALDLAKTLVYGDPNYEAWKAKCDLYAMGAALLRIMNTLDLIDRKDSEINMILDWIADIVHIDPNKRVTVAIAIANYKTLVTTKSTPVSTTSKRKTPVSTKSKRKTSTPTI